MFSSPERGFPPATVIVLSLLIASSLLINLPTTHGQSGPSNVLPAVPYTAEFKTTIVRTLANGTTIRRETKSVQARDTQGRTFTKIESESGGAAGQTSTSTTGMINDRADGTDTTWQSRNHQAVTIKYPPIEDRRGCWADDTGTRRMSFGSVPVPSEVSAAAAQPVRPQVEDVGTIMIEGIEAHGRRITRTIPAGRIGNDQPIVITNEIWSAPSLSGLTLKSVNDDPRGGKTIREITHLDLGEPDPALFQPPPDYQVKIEELHQVSCDQNPH